MNLVFNWICVYRFCILDSTAGAQTLIFAAVDETVQGVSGQYYGHCKPEMTRRISSLDDNECQLLWDYSMKMCNLSWIILELWPTRLGLVSCVVGSIIIVASVRIQIYAIGAFINIMIRLYEYHDTDISKRKKNPFTSN